MKQKMDALTIRLYRKPLYKILLILLGLPTFLVAFLFWLVRRQGSREQDRILREQAERRLEQAGETGRLLESTRAMLEKKQAFFGREASGAEFEKRLNRQFRQELEALVARETAKQRAAMGIHRPPFLEMLLEALDSRGLLALSVVSSLPMYLLLLICANPFVRYAFERTVMMVAVIFGVVFVVFTILHASPMNPAVNILGEMATEQQINDFNRVYGLDQPYVVQLFSQFKKIITFNLGNSFSGNEVVVESLMRKFPVTLQLAWRALLISLVISLPIGIISAIKPYTAWDYTFMFIALVGLSLPAFWFGMVMILTFSINLGVLPASFSLENPLSYIMPSIVMGTNMAASLTRMTRSSVLEVIKSDYITTARAKGLSEKRVILRHALSNALIPIVTVVGLQFGNMLGGSAVVEKVFNIKGIGSYIIDKQFLPDIPIILSGVVYVALIISIVNLAVDLLYALIDPRIKSKIKNQ